MSITRFGPCPEAGPPGFTIDDLHRQMEADHLQSQRLRIALGHDLCHCSLCRTIKGMTSEQAAADPAVQRSIRWINTGWPQAQNKAQAPAPIAPLSPSKSAPKPRDREKVGGRPIKALSPLDLEILRQRKTSARAMAAELGLSPTTVRRRLREFSTDNILAAAGR